MKIMWADYHLLQKAACQTVKPCDGAAVGSSGAPQRPALIQRSDGAPESVAEM